ncbi:dehydrogenase [Cenarchaeum symbiosum A]|uniref:Dehydrogenase n=1 Tax=Cenarchaeum symbiosum (strain A) TaxID=414004 RepID=A0RYB3_CENSY|nr:dehydrogenase [Cenarchaeum symbiosum A]
MRVAQIGTGGWGKNHTRVLSEIGALAAVCDRDESRASEYGEKHKVPHYTSVDALIERGEFDAAVICTPTATHAEVAGRLISAGKHVLVEKPMTYLASDGERLAEAARKNKVLLTCGYIERFNPAVEEVRKMVRSGSCGDLVMLEFHRENRMPPHIKDVGIIYDTSVHDIDTAMWLFGGTPQVVFARAGRIRHEHEDFASIMLGFEGDRVAVISSNWITPARVRTFNAVCTEAIISSDFISQEVRTTREGSTEVAGGGGEEPLLREIRSFIGAAEGKNEPVVKAREAVNVTRIAEAALLSSSRGVPIYLELE